MFWKKVNLLLVIFCYGASLADSQLGNYPVATNVGPSTSEQVQPIVYAQGDPLTDTEIKDLCNGLEYQFKAHPSDTNKYLICIPNGGKEGTCDSNQCFDERNPPCSSNCRTTPSNTADDKTKKYCQRDNTLLHRVAIENNCDAYFLCVSKTEDPLYLECPLNQHFSEKHKKCMNYAEADCAAPSKWCKNRKDGTRFPNKKCHEYYECRKEVTLEKSCKYNEYFDANLGKCVTGICNDDDRVPNCKKQNDGVRLAHAKCYKYYVCLNESPFEAQCGTGYYFDAGYERCIRDINNVCNDV